MEVHLKIQLRISMVVYIGQLIVGYGLGWPAPVIAKLQDLDQTPLPNILNHGQASWIVSVVYIGTIIGPYVSSYLSNRNGRRPCLFLGGTLSMLAYCLLAFAQNLSMIFAGRIMIGLGAGIIFVTNLVYIGEIASTNIRGILLTGVGILGTFGTLIVYSVGPYVKYSVVNWIGFALAITFLIGLLYIPETPLYYVLKGQEDKAKDALTYLGRENDTTVLNTKAEINKTDWKDLFTIKSNRKAVTITLILNILQQLSGVVVIMSFATFIFDMAHSSIAPSVATILIGVTQLVASCVAPIFVERSGRRSLMLVSTAGCCLSMLTCGIFMYLNEYHTEAAQNISWLPLATLIVFFLSYDLGFGVIPGTLIGEMFQTNVRSTGSALTITLAWLFGFGVSTAFEYMLLGLGSPGTFWTYSGACAVAFVFTLFCVPETKGKSLDEIQKILMHL